MVLLLSFACWLLSRAAFLCRALVCQAPLGLFIAINRLRQESHMRKLLALFSGLVLVAAGPQQYVAFDAASASSTYSAGNLAGSPAFAAQQALSGGSGYWRNFCLELLGPALVRTLACSHRCSSGSQSAGQSARLRSCAGQGHQACWCASCCHASRSKSWTMGYLDFAPLGRPRCDLDRCFELSPRRSGFEGGLGICARRG